MAKALLFARVREAAGVSALHVDASTVGALLDQAKTMFGPAFEEGLAFANVAVNGTMITHLDGLDTPLNPSDEVAILPPVSGG